MTLQTDLANLSAADAQAARDSIAAVMQSKYPDHAWAPGEQLESLVVEPTANALAVIGSRMTLQAASETLAAIAADPEAADAAQVDAVLSNYFVTRQQPTVGYGDVLFVTTTSTIIPIQITDAFTINAQSYVTQRNYRVFPPGTRVADPLNGILVMTQRADGAFQFAVPVVSVSTGSATLAKKGTAVSATVSLPGLVSITVADDFLGGLDGDSNADVVAVAQRGIVPGTLSGAGNIVKLIQEAFPGSYAQVVGGGHTMMTRDRDPLFGSSLGGKADIYVKTAQMPVTKTITVTATLSPADRTAKRWSFSYIQPGAYLVSGIRPNGEDLLGGILPESETVTPLPPTSGFIPTMEAIDALFSALQSRTVLFVDDSLDYTALLSGAGADDVITKSYDVDILVMPSLDLVDEMIRSDTLSDPGLDPLVKGALPAIVDVSIPIKGTVDATGAAAAVAAAIAALPIGSSTIPANLVYDTIRSYVKGTVGKIGFRVDMIGTDLKHHFKTEVGEFNLPTTLQSLGVHPDTTAFVTDASHIDIEVVG